MERLYVGIKEMCERYSISKMTVYRLLAEEGAPPMMKLGGRTLVEMGAMDEFIQSKLVPAVPERNKRKAREA